MNKDGKFTRKIDYRNKLAMVSFLSDHYRYNTMNSWNNSTSYAHKVKVYGLGLSNDEENKLFELMECEDFYFEINMLMEDFAYNHDFAYQVGFNGRSSGYIVLYQGGYRLDIGNKKPFSYPGKSLDQNEDFDGWSLSELRDRCNLIQDFDQLVEDIFNLVKSMVKDCKVEDVEYQIIITKKVLKAA
jgi:hypothetical protein